MPSSQQMTARLATRTQPRGITARRVYFEHRAIVFSAIRARESLWMSRRRVALMRNLVTDSVWSQQILTMTDGQTFSLQTTEIQINYGLTKRTARLRTKHFWRVRQ